MDGGSAAAVELATETERHRLVLWTVPGAFCGISGPGRLCARTKNYGPRKSAGEKDFASSGNHLQLPGADSLREPPLEAGNMGRAILLFGH